MFVSARRNHTIALSPIFFLFAKLRFSFIFRFARACNFFELVCDDGVSDIMRGKSAHITYKCTHRIQVMNTHTHTNAQTWTHSMNMHTCEHVHA